VICALLPAWQGQSPGQRPQFEANVSRVRVDVIVTDDDGNFVEDLRPEDFVLFEDDEPQPILYVQLVDLGSGRVIALDDDAAVSETASSATAVVA